MKPIVWDPKDESLEEFKKKHVVNEVVDRYDELLEDLFLIRNPRFKFNKEYKTELGKFIADYKDDKDLKGCGHWFYFPFSKILCHYLPDNEHQEIRTARNKNLITKDEQEKLYNARVGITGMSVGSHAVLTLSLIGGGKYLALADFDVISASNLNRIRFDFTKIGKSKCLVVADQLYRMNPYAEIKAYDKGLSVENLDEFMNGLDVIVDALDNLELKIRMRLKAKELGIPVIMATDNGDNIIIDVERYDLNKDTELFNGAIGHVTLKEFQNFRPQDLPKLATKVAGANVVVPRMLASILEVGRTIYSWPQLGDAATLAGVATAYAIKRIALDQPVKTGKFEVNLDAVFDPEYDDKKVAEQREAERRKYLSIIGL